MEERGRKFQEESENCGDNEVKEFLAVCYIPGVTWPSRGDKVRGGTKGHPPPPMPGAGDPERTPRAIFLWDQ